MKKFGKFLAAFLFLFSLTTSTVAEEEILMNFRDATIESVIQMVAKLTNRTIMIDPRVRATVNITSNASITKDKAFDVLLMILDLYGFTAVETEYATLVVPAQLATTIPQKNSGNALATQDLFFARETRILAVTNIDAGVLSSVIQPFLGTQARFQVVPGTSRIIVSDSRANLDRIEKIIQQVDKVSINSFETITLQNASVNEVLPVVRSVFGNNPLLKIEADQRTNRLLVISNSQPTRLAVRTLVAEFDVAQKDGGLSDLEVFYLRYAKAKNIASLISSLMNANIYFGSSNTGTTGTTGVNQTSTSPAAQPTTGNTGQTTTSFTGSKTDFTIQADESINAVIVAGPARVVQSARRVIQMLDLPRKQVHIEFIVAEVSDSTLESFGIDFASLNSSGGFLMNTGGTIKAIGTSLTSGSLQTIGTVAAQNQVNGSARIIGGGVQNGQLSWLGILEAIKSSSNSNLLSTPFLSVLDNESGSLIVGEERPYSTGSYNTTSSTANPFTTIERKNVGIEISVKPQINDGEVVELQITQKISSVLDASLQLATSNREIKTTLLAQNNQIITMGGLKRRDTSVVENKVPLLGDIPLLGWLFKYQSTKIEDRNLIVILKPSIISSGNEAQYLAASKFNNFSRLIAESRWEKLKEYFSEWLVDGNSKQIKQNLQPTENKQSPVSVPSTLTNISSSSTPTNAFFAPQTASPTFSATNQVIIPIVQPQTPTAVEVPAPRKDSNLDLTVPAGEDNSLLVPQQADSDVPSQKNMRNTQATTTTSKSKVLPLQLFDSSSPQNNQIPDRPGRISLP